MRRIPAGHGYPGYTRVVAKVLVSIDDELLARIDDAARNEGVSRSRFLSVAASQTLGEAVGPGASPSVHEALAELRQLFARNGFAEDSTAAIRAERDERDAVSRQV